MISIKKIRADKEFCKSKLALKQDNTDIDRLLLLDKKARELKTMAELLSCRENIFVYTEPGTRQNQRKI